MDTKSRIYIPIQNVHPLGVETTRAFTLNRKRSRVLFIPGTLLVIAVCFEPFQMHINNKRWSHIHIYIYKGSGLVCI